MDRLLASHPCFFDGAEVTRLSEQDSPVCVLRRISSEGLDSLLVLVNTDVQGSHVVSIALADYEALKRPNIDLLGQDPPQTETAKREITFTLEAGRRVLSG